MHVYDDCGIASTLSGIVNSVKDNSFDKDCHGHKMPTILNQLNDYLGLIFLSNYIHFTLLINFNKDLIANMEICLDPNNIVVYIVYTMSIV